MIKRLPEGQILIDRAQRLGVNIHTEEFYNTANDGVQFHVAPEHELQRRVLEAERHIRESRLWVVALVSALASFVSAVAAWIAVLK